MYDFLHVGDCFIHPSPLRRTLLQVGTPLATTGEAADQYAEVDSNLTQSVYHNYHTFEPDCANQENQSQYEVLVPQQHNVYKSNEVRERNCLRIMRL